MFNNTSKPSKKGQIVILANPLPTYSEKETYILADDPALANSNTLLTIYSITDLLRSQAKGAHPHPNKVTYSEMILVAESLETYVNSWNQ